LNNPRMRDCAKTFAKRLGTGKTPDLVQIAYRIALARNPSADELADGMAFVNQQTETYQSEDRRERALTDFCQVLMCLNEFVYVD